MRTIQLRYPGRCLLCGFNLGRGTWAVYDRDSRSLRCRECQGTIDRPPGQAGARDGQVRTVPAGVSTEPGQPGASARREHERRRTKRQADLRRAHPHLGGLLLRLTAEPRHISAWATGAEGEEVLGARLDDVSGTMIRLLHDRRLPGSKANIDHLVICPAGVVVIDAKKYRGRPHLKVSGGAFQPRVEKLMVGRRDCTRLVDGVLRQLEQVRSHLAGFDTEASGMLCFVNADWPLIGGSGELRGVNVLGPKRAIKRIQKPGILTSDQIDAVHRHLNEAFPH